MVTFEQVESTTQPEFVSDSLHSLDITKIKRKEKNFLVKSTKNKFSENK